MTPPEESYFAEKVCSNCGCDIIRPDWRLGRTDAAWVCPSCERTWDREGEELQ